MLTLFFSIFNSKFYSKVVTSMIGNVCKCTQMPKASFSNGVHSPFMQSYNFSVFIAFVPLKYKFTSIECIFIHQHLRL